MKSCTFNGRIVWFASALFLGLFDTPSPHLLSSEKQLGHKRIDLTLVPNLQELMDHPTAPDFTPPNLQQGNLSLRDFRGKPWLYWRNTLGMENLRLRRWRRR